MSSQVSRQKNYERKLTLNQFTPISRFLLSKHVHDIYPKNVFLYFMRQKRVSCEIQKELNKSDDCKMKACEEFWNIIWPLG